jgi:hypothetical protein
MLNSLLTGLGVDVVCTYLFIYRWQMGVSGAAFAQIAVKGSRLVIWLCLALHFGLVGAICVVRTAEPLISGAEIAIFARLALPSVVTNFAGWFVFELQVLGMANIAGTPPPLQPHVLRAATPARRTATNKPPPRRDVRARLDAIRRVGTERGRAFRNSEQWPAGSRSHHVARG